MPIPLSRVRYPRRENIIYRVPSNATYTKRYKNHRSNRMKPNKKDVSTFFTNFSISPTLNFGLNSIGNPHMRKKSTVRRSNNFGIAIMRKYGKRIKLYRFQRVSEFL